MKGSAFSLSDLGVAVLDCEHKTPPARADGYPYVAIPNIVGGRLDLSDVRRISGADLAEWTRRTTPRGGDIIVTRRGRVGDTARIPEGMKCAIGQNLVLLRSDERQVDQEFLFWVTRGPQWHAEVNRLRNVGAVFSSLNVRDIARIQLSIPSLEEQRAIAEVLGALDDKIAANARLIETADDLARTRTRAALSGGRADLSSIADITMGSSPPGSSYNEDRTGMAFYQGVRDFGVRFPANRVWTTEPVRLAEPGDTLLSVRAPVGRTNLAAEKTCIGRGLAAVRSISGSPMTLFHLLRDDHAAWTPFEAEGTVFGSINKQQLASLQIATVDPGQTAELEGVLSALEQRIAATITESRSLAGTRDALLPLLMSGKVTVKDAEAMVGEVV